MKFTKLSKILITLLLIVGSIFIKASNQNINFENTKNAYANEYENNVVSFEENYETKNINSSGSSVVVKKFTRIVVYN